ncbi:penicillin-binding protein 2 [Bacteroidia bacterium]|nr:penicillin-binding protein 2 [Bacteroidia bacterium]
MKDRGLSRRKIDIIIIVALVFSVFVLRLFYLQVIDESYQVMANNNAFRNVVQYPTRGLIYDRNGELIVYNEAFYDLMVIPGQVKAFDTAEFAQLIQLSVPECKKRLAAAKIHSRYAPSVFEKQISKETYGRLQERLYKYRGFYAQIRTLRKYPKSVAAHVLGYVGEVSPSMIEKDVYYKQGDYIGMSGLENFYENQLRGQKGQKIQIVDVKSQDKGSYMDGKYDVYAVPGQNLYSTLDLSLQELAEQLMQGKRGSVIAIEPATGEILALVSAPTYDPNLLVGRERSSNYHNLLNDPQKPLFDRALMAQYPPGSVFKLPQALIALKHHVITENTGFHCDKSLVGCHNHPDATNLREGVKMSCNPYFQQVYRRMIMQNIDPNRFIDSRKGLAMWEQDILSFGFGSRLEIDLPNTKSGLIPNVVYYDKIYGENQWAFSNFRSVSIGQGEVLLIPLQMANLAAIMANRGFYVTPHLCRKIGDNIPNDEYAKIHLTTVDSSYFKEVVNGMYDAVYAPGGTAHRAQVENITVCGKTGTAENPHGKDHAVFIAFAPKDDPKIAISVIIENSGFGGTWASPIASLLIEQYFTGEVKRVQMKQQMQEISFMNEIKP